MSKLQECLDILPQTQCRECGYCGCKPYAEALLSGTDVDVTKCLPGGQEVASQLASLFSIPEQSVVRTAPERTAYIDVNQCIGCTLCMKICPVDSIVGALNFEHQIIEADCTGCQLCLPVCPTACITLEPRTEPLPSALENLSNIAKKQATLDFVKANKMKGHRASLAQLLKKVPPGNLSE